MSKIMLTDLIKIDSPTEYKLHLGGRNNEGVNPLDEYVKDNKNWLAWNCWRGNKNDWTRKHILSFMEFYPLSDAWLFGGIFQVKGCDGEEYDLTDVPTFEKFQGRLVPHSI